MILSYDFFLSFQLVLLDSTTGVWGCRVSVSSANWAVF